MEADTACSPTRGSGAAGGATSKPRSEATGLGAVRPSAAGLGNRRREEEVEKKENKPFFT
jgi:hypothetical protein